MKPTLRKEILTETFKDMEGLIVDAAWKFWRTYGGDIDDLIAQSNLIFIDAFDTYDSSKGAKLTTWVTLKVKYGLLSYMRGGNVYGTTHVSIDDDFADTYPESNKNFSVMEMLDDLEQDARIVLQLFLETPREILSSILNNSKRVDSTQAAIRNRLQNRLRQMEWTTCRIKTAFEQIKSVTSY